MCVWTPTLFKLGYWLPEGTRGLSLSAHCAGSAQGRSTEESANEWWAGTGGLELFEPRLQQHLIHGLQAISCHVVKVALGQEGHKVEVGFATVPSEVGARAHALKELPITTPLKLFASWEA